MQTSIVRFIIHCLKSFNSKSYSTHFILNRQHFLEYPSYSSPNNRCISTYTPNERNNEPDRRRTFASTSYASNTPIFLLRPGAVDQSAAVAFQDEKHPRRINYGSRTKNNVLVVSWRSPAKQTHTSATFKIYKPNRTINSREEEAAGLEGGGVWSRGTGKWGIGTPGVTYWKFFRIEKSPSFFSFLILKE